MIIASLNSLIFSYVIIELCNFIDFGYSMINVRYIPLERPLQKYSDGKTLEEAQIAFHAQHLGFINCDREQKPYLSDFVAKFASIKKEHEIIPKEIKSNNFKLLKDVRKRSMCKDYLDDPVFTDNYISFFENANPQVIDANIEILEFNFYSFIDSEKITVIQCPVIINNEEEFLYFGGLGIEKGEEEEYYFVMSRTTQNINSKLSILMRTKMTETIATELNDSEIKFNVNQFIVPSINRRKIQLLVRQRYLNDYRLTGKDAEQAYLTRKFGFIYSIGARKEIDQFIVTIHELSKGYKIRRYILNEQNLNMISKRIKLNVCETVIKNAVLLRNIGISEKQDENDSHSTSMVSSNDNQINYSFLQCTGWQERKSIPIYVKPIFYYPHSNCGVYTFILINPTNMQANGVETNQLFYSRLEENPPFDTNSITDAAIDQMFRNTSEQSDTISAYSETYSEQHNINFEPRTTPEQTEITPAELDIETEESETSPTPNVIRLESLNVPPQGSERIFRASNIINLESERNSETTNSITSQFEAASLNSQTSSRSPNTTFRNKYFNKILFDFEMLIYLYTNEEQDWTFN